MKNLSNLLNRAHIYILCFVFTNSFVFSISLEEGVSLTNQFNLFFVSSIVLLINSITLWRRKEELIIKLNSIDILILLLGSYIICRSLIISIDCICETKILLLIANIFLYFNFKGQANKLNIFIASFLCVGFIQISYGLLQYYDYFSNLDNTFKIGGSFGNPGVFAGFLVPYIPISLGLLLISFNHSHYKKKDIVLIIVFLIVFTLGTFVIILSYSRAAWLSIIVGVLIIIIFKFDLRRRLNLKTNSLIYISIALAFFIGLAFILYDIKPNSAYGRLLIWKISMGMINKNILFGSGYGSFASSYNDYQANYFSIFREGQDILIADSVVFAFNEYLELIIETGVFGLLIFVSIIILIIKRVFFCKEAKILDISLISFASFIPILVFAFFSYPFKILPITITFYFLLSILSSLYFKEVLILKSRLSILFNKIIAVIGIALVIIFIDFNIKKFNAYKNFITARNHILSKEYYLANDIMAKISDVLKNDQEFLIAYATNLYQIEYYTRSISVINNLNTITKEPSMLILLGLNFKAIKRYKDAEDAFILASRIVPNRITPKLQLANLYFEQDERNKANLICNDILKMTIKVNSFESRMLLLQTKMMLEKYN